MSKYIAKYEQTKWLVISSFFFIIPAIYAFLYKLYFYSILLLLTSIISANYWRKATFSWRRNLDLIFAKISFITFVYNGIIYVKTPFYVITGYSGLVVLVYCYYLSSTKLKENNKNWYKYHILFHILMTYELCIIFLEKHSTI